MDASWSNSYRQREKTLEEKFWEKVDKSGGENACWIWKGTVYPRGIGIFSISIGKCSREIRYPVHRMAYLLTYGMESIPQDMLVCHNCGNLLCVNPGHLFIKTSCQNGLDSLYKYKIKMMEKCR